MSCSGAGLNHGTDDGTSEKRKYADEIVNRVFFLPKCYPMNATITLKLIDVDTIPQMIEEVLDAFYFPLTCHIDFYYNFNSTKRPEVSIAYPSLSCATNSVIRIRKQRDVEKLQSEMKGLTFEKIALTHAQSRCYDVDASGVSILGLLAIQFYITSFELSSYQAKITDFPETFK